MPAKDTILSSIHRALDSQPDDALRRGAVTERLSKAPAGVVPARGRLPRAERIALFRERAEAVNATVETVSSHGALPRTVSRYLRERNLPSSIRTGTDPRIGAAGWETESTLEVLHGASEGRDVAGLSHAFCGIAETGTVMLLSGPENPTTLNFLPEYHLVVVEADHVEADLETGWAKLRERHGKGAMRRVVNLVTGPSRSADIEQTLLLGAHGPRALHIIIVDDKGHH